MTAVAGAVLLAVVLVATSAADTRSRAGHLDRSFGGDGLVRTQPDGGNSTAQSVAIGRKHRIVVAGRAGDGFGLVRYKPTGQLDDSFSGDGKVSTGFPNRAAFARAVAIGRKGSVVAAGKVWRHGLRKPSSPGQRSCGIHGRCYFGAAKYKANGHLDHSFGRRGRKRIGFEGRRNNAAVAVAIDSKGRVLMGGTSCDDTGGSGCEFALVRLRRSGELDDSFGDGGRVLTSLDTKAGVPVSCTATSMAIDPRGNIVLGGRASDGRVALAKYRPNGDLDSTFGHGGKAIYRLDRLAAIRAIALDSLGKIVAVGDGTPNFQWALARFRARGGLDHSFGDNGQVTTGFPGTEGGVVANAVAIDSRKRIVVAGRYGFAFALARYQPNGNLNKAFGHNGKVAKDFAGPGPSAATSVAIDSHERPVVAGFAKRRFAVARFLG